MDLLDTIRARRDSLAAQLTEAAQEYARIEALLSDLRRSIDAMHGGVQELDALLASEQEPPAA